MKIITTPKAYEDFNVIFDFISQDNPKAAKKLIQRIKRHIYYLKDFPNMGRDSDTKGVKILVIPNTNFIIPYRVIHEEIQILRVFHTSQNVPEEW